MTIFVKYIGMDKSNTVSSRHCSFRCKWFNWTYRNDIFYSNNTDEHINHIRLVFDRLRKAGLRLNTTKCHFGLREIKLLGSIVSEKGVNTDPDKVKLITNLPRRRE